MRLLSSLFSIELCAYAVMSNHYHLIVKLNPAGPDAWSNGEILQRWTALFTRPLLVQRFRAAAPAAPSMKHHLEISVLRLVVPDSR
jgi:hypothetical protein